jgi:hypothetical protein
VRRWPLTVLVMFLWLGAFIPGEVLAQGGPCSMATAGSREYMAWSGPWVKHGASLDVYPEGCGVAGWRTYRQCPAGQYDGNCDPVQGDTIQYGGYTAFVLNAHAGAATSGQIIASSDSFLMEHPGIIVTLNENGTLLVEWGGGPFAVFCRPWAWMTEWCGA